MEAVAKHDFTATNEDELSFSKGNIVKIMDSGNDRDWLKAELDGKEGFVPFNYLSMRPNSWYVSKISTPDAEALLLSRDDDDAFVQVDGAFLIRHDDSSLGDFSLSVKYQNGVQHFKVLRDGGGKYFLWLVKFNSINELIGYHRSSSVSRVQTIYLKDMIRERVVANYDFKPQDPGELQLSRDDIITVIKKRDTNWWYGQVQRDNWYCNGIFPSNYVSPYQE